MTSVKNILVCPLDWGLGHATRMVSVIRELERQGANVILAADNRPLDFLMRYFTDNKIVKLEGFNPVYSKNGSMAWNMIKSIPKMISGSKSARKALKHLIDELQIDAIISDNRYELYGSGIPTIFVTHQLNIQTKGIQVVAKPLLNKIINGFLGKYDEIWVPDDPKHSFSGELSITKKFMDKIHYIGILSRFDEDSPQSSEGFEILAIMSGPEPQRTVFENIVSAQLFKSGKVSAILQGKPGFGSRKIVDNVTFIPHADDEEFSGLVNKSAFIISRPGYSTLMDLAKLGCTGIFIPTPGQTEQEYLASKLSAEGRAVIAFQNNFNLSESMTQLKQKKGLISQNDNSTLKRRINHLLNNC